MVIMAQLDLRDVSRGFSSPSHSWSLTIVFVLLLAGIAAIMVWAWYVSRRREKIQRFDSHDHLFLELARAHALSRSDRQLLRMLGHKLAVHPDLFFVRQDLFETALQRLGDVTPELHEQIEILHRRLHVVSDESAIAARFEQKED